MAGAAARHPPALSLPAQLLCTLRPARVARSAAPRPSRRACRRPRPRHGLLRAASAARRSPLQPPSSVSLRSRVSFSPPVPRRLRMGHRLPVRRPGPLRKEPRNRVGVPASFQLAVPCVPVLKLACAAQIHGRWAMLGALGCVVPEVFGPPGTPNWVDIQAEIFRPEGLNCACRPSFSLFRTFRRIFLILIRFFLLSRPQTWTTRPSCTRSRPSSPWRCWSC